MEQWQRKALKTFGYTDEEIDHLEESGLLGETEKAADDSWPIALKRATPTAKTRRASLSTLSGRCSASTGPSEIPSGSPAVG